MPGSDEGRIVRKRVGSTGSADAVGSAGAVTAATGAVAGSGGETAADQFANVTFLPNVGDQWRNTMVGDGAAAGGFASRSRALAACAGMAVAAVLLARATLLGTLAPFHLAFFTAVAVRSPVHLAWVGIPSVVARAVLAGGIAALADALTLLLAFAYVKLLRPVRMDENRAAFTAGILGLSAALIGGAAVTALFEPTMFGLVTLGFRISLTALLATIFVRALAPLQRAWQGGAGWEGLSDALSAGPNRGALAHDEWLSGAVLAAAIIAGLDGLQIGPVDPALLVSAFLVMLLGSLGGAGAGAAAGASIAIVAVLNGAMAPVNVAVQASAGLLAGLFAEYGTIGSASGYLLGYLLLSAFYHAPQDVVAALWSTLPAAIVFALACGTSWRRGSLSNLFRRTAAEFDEDELLWAADGTVTAGAQLRQFGADTDGGVRSFGEALRNRAGANRKSMAARRPNVHRTGSGYNGPRSGKAAQGERVLRRYAGLAREMAQAFDQGAPSEERFKQRTVSELVNNLALDVCAGCAHHTTCWERKFLNTYQGLSEVMARRETLGRVEEEHLPKDLRRRCPRTVQLAAAINHAYEIWEVSHRWWRRFDESRRTVALQLRAVGDVLERAGTAAQQAAAARDADTRGAVPTLPYRVGVARIAKDAKVISGDSYLHSKLGDDRLVLVLSDGMGAGTRAAAESRATVGLLEKLLELGFDETAAVHTVNHLLLLRSTGEMFATLDLTLVGLRDGTARFIKIGASPSFHRRAGGNVGVIRAGTLPMGVINEPDMQTAQRMLRRGDLVVMLTDGVIQAWQQIAAAEDWIKGFLANLDTDEPRRVAGDLLKEALRRCNGRARDDMTVLALKLL